MQWCADSHPGPPAHTGPAKKWAPRATETRCTPARRRDLRCEVQRPPLLQREPRQPPRCLRVPAHLRAPSSPTRLNCHTPRPPITSTAQAARPNTTVALLGGRPGSPSRRPQSLDPPQLARRA
ncbi:hypothetical protein NDU88_002008 [Pleurodeles waltl]|uniref:Uncharacterized protein n=1 Tax=Pleurodeles waltl TaxID=8319 RepID=A0AAV7P743_PLEWA|nr:hypothetical protein NDU88_002008 [Pleurodeles waltl]